jgi:hypothetical protein
MTEKYMILESGYDGYEQLTVTLTEDSARHYLENCCRGNGTNYLMVHIVDSKYNTYVEEEDDNH